MVKHGGGYIIIDVSGSAIDGGIMTVGADVLKTAKEAVKSKLPVMYIGPTAIYNSDVGMQFTDDETAAFTHVIDYVGDVMIDIPVVDTAVNNTRGSPTVAAKITSDSITLNYV